MQYPVILSCLLAVSNTGVKEIPDYLQYVLLMNTRQRHHTCVYKAERKVTTYRTDGQLSSALTYTKEIKIDNITFFFCKHLDTHLDLHEIFHTK